MFPSTLKHREIIFIELNMLLKYTFVIINHIFSMLLNSWAYIYVRRIITFNDVFNILMWHTKHLIKHLKNALVNIDLHTSRYTNPQFTTLLSSWDTKWNHICVQKHRARVYSVKGLELDWTYVFSRTFYWQVNQKFRPSTFFLFKSHLALSA